MPELGAFDVGQPSHGLDNRTLSFRDVVDLTDEADDLRHPVPRLRVMFPAESPNIQQSSMAVALASVVIEFAEFLQLLVILFLDRLDLSEGSDVIVRRR